MYHHKRPSKCATPSLKMSDFFGFYCKSIWNWPNNLAPMDVPAAVRWTKRTIRASRVAVPCKFDRTMNRA